MIKSDLKAEKRETHVANYHYQVSAYLSRPHYFNCYLQSFPNQLIPQDTLSSFYSKKETLAPKEAKKWDRVSLIAWYQPVLKVRVTNCAQNYLTSENWKIRKEQTWLTIFAPFPLISGFALAQEICNFVLTCPSIEAPANFSTFVNIVLANISFKSRGAVACEFTNSVEACGPIQTGWG